jgi:hypothetical protein
MNIDQANAMRAAMAAQAKHTQSAPLLGKKQNNAGANKRAR